MHAGEAWVACRADADAVQQLLGVLHTSLEAAPPELSAAQIMVLDASEHALD